MIFMKAKPVLLVILTLIIGFFIGMLTSAQLRYNRLKPVRVFFSEDRFREGFYKIIQPDEKQKVEIEKILDKYAKKNSELHDYFRKEADSNLKSFRKEIDSKLTREQLARLKEMDERREKMIKEARKRRNDTTGRYGEGSRGDNGDRLYHDKRHAPSPPGGQPFIPRDEPDMPSPDSGIILNDK